MVISGRPSANPPHFPTTLISDIRQSRIKSGPEDPISCKEVERSVESVLHHALKLTIP